MEIDYRLVRVVGPYFIGKSLNIFKILILGLWSSDTPKNVLFINIFVKRNPSMGLLTTF